VVFLTAYGFCDVKLFLWAIGSDVSKDVLDSLIFKVKKLRTLETSGTVTSATQHNISDELHVECHTLFVGSRRKKRNDFTSKIVKLSLSLISVKGLLFV
jgi:hypothetical protein